MLDAIAAIAAGLEPSRTDDPTHAAELVAGVGACILTGLEPSQSSAATLAATLLGDRLRAGPPPVEVREGGDKDPKIRVDGAHEVPLPLHTDGFTYGLDGPDTMVLLCERPSEGDGASTVVDAYRVLDALAADPGGAELVRFMCDVEVDLTAPGAPPRRGTLVSTTPSGRRQVIVVALRDHIRAVPGPLARAHEHCIDQVAEVFESVRTWAPRVHLAAGEALCADNYRVVHSRDAYHDLDRRFWRIWAWSDDGRPPPEGRLASDVRYVTEDPAAAGG
ncbi:TauD/TfdA family dioxygenase [Rhabdothermincola salaria]|uniref:TauD/TfdA family dioxygenase n=1 Tax=Rhabdothermincola salaria TaxID=2903142 RepID=UPI001E2F3207|nr:TauD/TfdA family dioxygenase [Rhabdothermincola salaria]MCD9624024.1 TauD/TfdA family dioxygenase [Rhabdothermincola salaria]